MMTDTRICFIGNSFVNGTGDEKMLGWAGRLRAQVRRQSYDKMADLIQQSGKWWF
ncbi:MAG: hypothetical protein GW843_02735 [Thiomicrospira sp.]|nr:hypothetical protein [Thiomicrospira sp.]NCP56667.1 hypothetical protein [Thiomicrospira sp.]NCS63544.1 hypothetical protein [Thiomicrospira sp.]